MNTTVGQPAPGAPNLNIPQFLETLWQAYSHNVNTGVWDKIEMPINLKSVVGQNGIEVMKARFCALIEAPVDVSEDTQRGVIMIAPRRNRFGHDEIVPKAKNERAQTPSDTKIARPPNAFILYRKRHHPIIKEANPHFHNNQISVVLGTQWKNESEEIKGKFIALAKKLKAKHLRDHPGYQYQPRKPSEKKRRMTRRKAAALAKPLARDSVTKDQPSPTSAMVPSMEMLEFPRTLGGNIILDLGDDIYDDGPFAAALEKHNDSLPPANNSVAASITQSASAALYNEPTEIAQNDSNFFNAVFDFEAFNAGEDFDANMADFEMAHDPWGTMSLEAQLAAFDVQNDINFDAEVTRMSQL